MLLQRQMLNSLLSILRLQLKPHAEVSQLHYQFFVLLLFMNCTMPYSVLPAVCQIHHFTHSQINFSPKSAISNVRTAVQENQSLEYSIKHVCLIQHNVMIRLQQNLLAWTMVAIVKSCSRVCFIEMMRLFGEKPPARGDESCVVCLKVNMQHVLHTNK